MFHDSVQRNLTLIQINSIFPHNLSYFSVPPAIHVLSIRKMFYKKMSLENSKTLRKCKEDLQPQMSELQFSIFNFLELFKSYKIE